VKVALIPPISELDHFRDLNDMHLALNHLLEDSDYLDFMVDCGKEGDWITLDNSAHEFQSGQPIQDVLVNAIQIRAREIVIPDTLFHAMYTVESGRKAMKFLAQSPLFSSCSPTPRLMVVPQGRDEDDWAWCLRQLVESAHSWGFRELLTIGLSKDYESYPGFEGGLNHLIQNHCVPMHKAFGIKTHLLGWPCNWNIIDLSRNYPCLRSTDTAKPFIYAMRNHKFDPHIRPPQMKRPEDYFEADPFERREGLRRVATHNACVFKLAARGVLQVQ
jgi:hypothetical protein